MRLDEDRSAEIVELLEKQHEAAAAQHYYSDNCEKNGYTPVYHLYIKPFDEKEMDIYGLAQYM